MFNILFINLGCDTGCTRQAWQAGRHPSRPWHAHHHTRGPQTGTSPSLGVLYFVPLTKGPGSPDGRNEHTVVPALLASYSVPVQVWTQTLRHGIPHGVRWYL